MTKFNTLSIVNIQKVKYRRELLQLNTDICEKPTGLPRWLSGKESTCNAGVDRDVGLIPGLGISPAGGHGNLFQHSCLVNPMDRGGWRAAVHRSKQSYMTETT